MGELAGDGAYVAITRDIRVEVRPRFLEDQSDPVNGRYFWAYTVRVENTGPCPVQLLTRHWVITDGRNHVEEVRGPGVVGEQPVIAPGDHFSYTSGCPLSTSSGVMEGSYGMKTEAGDAFDAAIPAFSLDLPAANRRLN